MGGEGAREIQSLSPQRLRTEFKQWIKEGKKAVTTTFKKVQDVGILYITSERVAFAGSREVTSIAAKKLADVRIDGDHLWFLAENRKTPLGVKLNQASAPVIAYVSRMLGEAMQKA